VDREGLCGVAASEAQVVRPPEGNHTALPVEVPQQLTGWGIYRNLVKMELTVYGFQFVKHRHAGSVAQALTDRAGRADRRTHADRRPVQRGPGHRSRRRRHHQSARGGRDAHAALHRHRHPGDERRRRRRGLRAEH
jgi:hypothetical protein